MATLTLKRQSFARAYVQSGNAAQAAREAGYAVGSARQEGTRLLSNADVIDEVERLRTISARKTADAREHVLNRLWELSETAHPDSVKVRCLELIGKTERMFVDVQESAGGLADVLELKRYSLDELLALKAVMTSDQMSEVGEVRVLEPETA